DRDLAARPHGGGAHAAEGLALGLLGAVREVQSKDVGAGRNQRVEHLVGSARRTDGGDDLGVAHLDLEYPAMGIIVPDAIERYLAGLNRFGTRVLDEIARGNEQ